MSNKFNKKIDMVGTASSSPLPIQANSPSNINTNNTQEVQTMIEDEILDQDINVSETVVEDVAKIEALEEVVDNKVVEANILLLNNTNPSKKRAVPTGSADIEQEKVESVLTGGIGMTTNDLLQSMLSKNTSNNTVKSTTGPIIAPYSSKPNVVTTASNLTTTPIVPAIDKAELEAQIRKEVEARLLKEAKIKAELEAKLLKEKQEEAILEIKAMEKAKALEIAKKEAKAKLEADAAALADLNNLLTEDNILETELPNTNTNTNTEMKAATDYLTKFLGYCTTGAIFKKISVQSKAAGLDERKVADTFFKKVLGVISDVFHKTFNVIGGVIDFVINILYKILKGGSTLILSLSSKLVNFVTLNQTAVGSPATFNKVAPVDTVVIPT